MTFLRGEEDGPPGGKGAPIRRFLSQLFMINILKCYDSNLIKIAHFMKNLTFFSEEGGGGKGILGG